MIPTNIDRDSLLQAIQEIDSEGVPKGRTSRVYHVYFEGKLYPPKYLISLANKIVNGAELNPCLFGGGEEANLFLESRGFVVIPVSEATEKQGEDINITTATFESEGTSVYDNKSRMYQLRSVIQDNATTDILLLPAGYFYLRKQTDKKIRAISVEISSFLRETRSATTVCVEIDCSNSDDQLALAVDKNGIVSLARKFYPTAAEDGIIRLAATFDASEMGYSRFLNVKGRRIYLAVCYDCFGLRHKEIENPGVDIILDLAHRFCKRGDGPSGDVDFARKGFAGASHQWKCPVFGTAFFYDRQVPDNWPTGVLWTDDSKAVREFKYQDNQLHYFHKKKISLPESALCYEYKV